MPGSALGGDGIHVIFRIVVLGGAFHQQIGSNKTVAIHFTNNNNLFRFFEILRLSLVQFNLAFLSFIINQRKGEKVSIFFRGGIPGLFLYSVCQQHDMYEKDFLQQPGRRHRYLNLPGCLEWQPQQLQ